jgi:hypothetical protein
MMYKGNRKCCVFYTPSSSETYLPNDVVFIVGLHRHVPVGLCFRRHFLGLQRVPSLPKKYYRYNMGCEASFYTQVCFMTCLPHYICLRNFQQKLLWAKYSGLLSLSTPTSVICPCFYKCLDYGNTLGYKGTIDALINFVPRISEV